jgi:hypothetical protein
LASPDRKRHHTSLFQAIPCGEILKIFLLASLYSHEENC